MTLSYNFPFITIFLCMVTAILMSIVRNPKVCYYVTLTVTIICTALSAVFLYDIVLADESFAFTMGKFAAPFGNEIAGGPLQAIMCTTFCGVMAMALLGGKSELFEDVDDKKMGLACVMFNMSLASILVLTYTNDVFTSYVFIEISTIAACALVMIKDSGPTLMATIRYLFMSLLGSGLFLFSIILLYGITGHLLMPQVSEKIAELIVSGDMRLMMAICLGAMTAALGIKSAMFPFHRWLPDAHGTATTSSSAVLSGLVLKGYCMLMIIMFCRVFTLETIREFRINDAVLALGLIGMIVGSLKAIQETHAKRMLAYSSVAQLGYVFMGIGLGTVAGIAAACFQMMAHACTKSLLFISVGRLASTTGHDKQFSALRGSAWNAPLAGVGFSIGALSMIGIPLFGGFAAKFFFATASIDNRQKVIITLAVIAVSTVLNAMYYIPSILCIWRFKNRRAQKAKRDMACTISIIVLCLGIFLLGVAFDPVMDILIRGVELI